ncbi:MsnO8 family LLM class oxidoreductase [Actinoplanes sp. HUAS TT8]|uniref:MsnO8 family LLM class oxidoreductase n=1 Tax=Actinoplanes sp. HUAS TT8 TaxID=3447453 RepID=UPI003F525BD4
MSTAGSMSTAAEPTIGVPLSALEVLAGDNRHDRAAIAPRLAEVARVAEKSGYRRIWYAEHHRAASNLDFPPPVMVAHIAAGTSTIRVGAGGVLAPNHAPILVGEQFRALERLHPGRIDLGIGRGPGTLDPAAARALRWGAEPASDSEYRGLVENILTEVTAAPSNPQPWLLVSSPNGARLAAELGLPIAFAYHIRPQPAAEAIAAYRAAFTPSAWATSPRVILSVTVTCADTEERAAALIRPNEIFMAGLMTGAGARDLLDPRTAAGYEFSPAEREVLPRLRDSQIHGTPDSVAAALAGLVARFAADELMIFSPIVDPDDRARSYELVASRSDPPS